MRNVLIILCLVLIFFGVHTEFALTLNSKAVVPYLLAGIGGTGILILRAGAISRRLLFLAWVFTVLIVALGAIASVSTGDPVQHAISSVLLLYSLFIAFTSFLGVAALRRSTLSRFFLASALVLVVGAALELYGPLRPVSDAFRQVANSWRPNEIYASDTRDIQDYGRIRPKFFASEPSTLGVMTGFSIVFWFLAARRYTLRRLVIAGLFAAAAFYVVRSPTILIAWTMTVIYWLSEAGSLSAVSRRRSLVLSIGAIISIIVVPVVTAAVSHYGQTGSYFEREIAPIYITGTVLRQSPLFGTGMGGWNDITGSVMGVYSSSGAFVKFPYLYVAVVSGALGPEKLITNAVWEYWMALGILGGLAILWMVWRILRELDVSSAELVICTAAMIFTGAGAINNPRGWLGLMCIAALFKKHQEGREQEEEGEIDEVAPMGSLQPA